MKILQKWLIICLMIAGISGLLTAQQSALHVNGKWIQDANNKNVTLRGVAIADLDAIYKGDRSQRVSTNVNKIIDILSSNGWYVSVVRLTVHPSVNDETGNHGWLNYTPDNYFNNILDPAVKYAISKGKYVIVDWHYVGASWNDSNVVNNTNNFWNYIAPKYANNPNVLFEIFNEPGNAGNWSSWKSAAQNWVNIIRNTAKANNIIIVGGPNWSQTLPQSSGELLSGSNIAYACHIYPQHMGGSIPNWIEYTSSVAPVIMTEWGYENNGGGGVVTGTTSSYGRRYHDYINSKPNVGWIAWCFDFVYRSVMFDVNWTLLGNGQSTNTTRYHDVAAGFGRTENTVTDNSENYMGQFAKDWLAEFKSSFPTYTPTPTPTITPTIIPAMLGDVNGDNSITIVDALLVAQYSTGMPISVTFYPDRGDVNHNGSVDIVDALLIAQYVTGIISGF